MDETTKPTEIITFMEDRQYLYEQVYKDDKIKLLIFDTRTEQTKTLDKIEKASITYIPFDAGGEAVKKGAVKLPTGIKEYGKTSDLIVEIRNHIKKYVDLSPKFLTIASCYVLLSMVYDRFNTLPYLRFIGDTGCGKSRAQRVVGGLCYKPVFSNGCITKAVIYRMLEYWKGSLVLDEADFSRSDEYSEIVKILNCGFEKGSPILRAVKDKPGEIDILPVYSPKILVTRNEFKDRALEARCLSEIMSETTRTDIISNLNSEFDKEQEQLRNKLLLFRLRHYKKVNPDISEEELNLPEVEPRLRQISSAFMALLRDEDKLIKSYRGFIKYHQRELVEKRANTNEGNIISALFKLMGGINENNGYPEAVALITHSDNKQYLPLSSAEISSKTGLSSHQVGQTIKNLGLNTKLIKVNKKPKRCILYEKDKLLTLKKRYIPKNG
jgi:hypothetical protein